MNTQLASGEFKFQCSGYPRQQSVPRVSTRTQASHILDLDFWQSSIQRTQNTRQWEAVQLECRPIGNSSPLYPFPSFRTVSFLVLQKYYPLTMDNTMAMKFVFSIYNSILCNSGHDSRVLDKCRGRKAQVAGLPVLSACLPSIQEDRLSQWLRTWILVPNRFMKPSSILANM